MEEVEQYLADINRMHRFIEKFSVLATDTFGVKRIRMDENAWIGGPLTCFFFMHSYEEMPSAAAVLALAEPLHDFPFEVMCEVVKDPETTFDEYMCYFFLAVDYGKDVYFIRKGNDF